MTNYKAPFNHCNQKVAKKASKVLCQLNCHWMRFWNQIMKTMKTESFSKSSKIIGIHETSIEI